MQFSQTNNNAGDVNNVMVSKAPVQVAHTDQQRTSIWSHLNTWYGFLGSTASLLGIWLFGWQVWHWWFFGL